jgi:hypothetical protein
MERIDDRGGIDMVAGMEPLHCSYAQVKTTTSTRVAGYINATSVRSRFPRPVMNNWTCCGSVSIVSLQDNNMNLL